LLDSSSTMGAPNAYEDARNAPTLPPPARISVTRFKCGAPVDELLYRLAVGDMEGVLDAAQVLFDAGSVPVLELPPHTLPGTHFGFDAEVLLSCVDGSLSLKEVIDESGLEMMDALRGLSELLSENVLALC